MPKEKRRIATMFPLCQPVEADYAWAWEGEPLEGRTMGTGLNLEPFEDAQCATSTYLSRQWVPQDDEHLEVMDQDRGDARIRAESEYYEPLLARFKRAQEEALLEAKNAVDGMPLPPCFRLPFTKIPESVYRHIRRRKKED